MDSRTEIERLKEYIDRLEKGLAVTERQLRKMRISRDEWRNDYGNLKADTR